MQTTAPRHTPHHHAPAQAHKHHTQHARPHRVVRPKDGRLEVPDPQTRTPAPPENGQRTPATRPKDGQRGEGECLTPDAPHNDVRHAPWGRPPGISTARNAGSEGCTLWRW